jgi:hypothetical protein
MMLVQMRDVVIGLAVLVATYSAWAQDPFQSAPGPAPQSARPPARQHLPRPPPAEPEPAEPVVVPRLAAPVGPSAAPAPAEAGRAARFDGVWTGNRSCAAFGQRQAFSAGLIVVKVRNNRLSQVSHFTAGTPGYATLDGTIDQAGNVTLVGEGIASGVAGGAPRGTPVRFRYEGASRATVSSAAM